MNLFHSITSSVSRKGNELYPDVLPDRSQEPKPCRRAVAWLSHRILRGNREIFSEVVTVTPELARLLLSRNHSNRSVRALVEGIKTDIVEGRWELNGETIIVSKDGYLNDGQHRLLAVDESGLPIKTVMTFGVERETRFSTDTGSAKTSGDLLSMSGIGNANSVAAIAGYLWQIERFGRIPEAAHAQGARPTKQQVQDMARRQQAKIEAALDLVPKRGSARIASHSLLTTGHIYLSSVTEDPDAVTEFLRRLVRGDKKDDRDPVFVARERMLEEKRKRHLWPAKAMEIVLRGWNMHRRGVSTGKIQLMGEWPKIAR